MSGQAQDVPIAPQASPFASAPPRPPGLWPMVDWLTERAGEWLNPILVKEARQALKSRQFVVTFGLVLVYSWIASIVGLAIAGPEAAYGAYGPGMFYAYYLGLAFPLLVIVPFGAFRSLAVEQEERTYELLSITGLKPRQIVSGKLGSAVLQMLIYLSAISPCLAFTYMLRGIDFPTIGMLLFYTVLASLGFSQIGLLLGTLTQQKHLQVVLSVLVTVGLVVALGFAAGIAFAFTFEERLPFHETWFWVFNGVLVTFSLSYFAMVFFAAVAQITFATDNRSTRLRVVMVVQHLLLVGWLAWGWFHFANERRGASMEMTVFLAVVAGVHWFVMGSMMIGESPDLSLRVRRSLPQSFLGRMFLTWFNPGPGTGYVFAVAGTLGALALVPLAVASDRAQAAVSFGWSGRDWTVGALSFGVVGLSYVVIYLGLELLIVRLVRKVFTVDPLVGLLTQTVLVLVGCIVPMVIYAFAVPYTARGYSVLQITNFMWTLAQFFNGPGMSLPPDGEMILIVVPAAALVVFALNLPGIVRELQYVRIAAPTRVVEEDAQIAAVLSPPRPPLPESPWD